MQVIQYGPEALAKNDEYGAGETRECKLTALRELVANVHAHVPTIYCAIRSTRLHAMVIAIPLKLSLGARSC